MAQNGNINLSTLLLLGVLLFLIYCLMNQPKSNESSTLDNKERMNNTINTREDFEELDTEELEDETEDFTESDSESDSKSVKSVTKSHFTPPAERDFTSQPPQVPKVSSDLVVNPNSQGPVNSTLLNTSTSIFAFEPSDDSSHSGASLNNAFERPVPSSAETDVVDLNKNNVTNYNATDYLPKEINDDWFNTDFSQAKYKMNDDKLINTDKYVVGVNTVGQSLKNASYDIRGAINVPKYTVSPWNNSTVEPDYNIKPLC